MDEKSFDVSVMSERVTKVVSMNLVEGESSSWLPVVIAGRGPQQLAGGAPGSPSNARHASAWHGCKCALISLMIFLAPDDLSINFRIT